MRPLPVGAAGAVVSRLSAMPLALLALLLLAGCGGGAVQVEDFSPTATGRDRCPALIEALPETVADESARTVAGSPYAAAWGEPAIVLRCGVPRPDGFDRGATCLRTNGIDWFVPEGQIQDLDADVVLTLVHRRPRVQVRIPAGYRPNGPSEAMVDLEEVVRSSTKVTGHCR